MFGTKININDLFSQIFFFFSFLPLSLSICTNDVFCYICPFDTYDVNYETHLRISYGQNQALKYGSCLPKNISILFQRNVLVMNSPICVECQNLTFDTNYDSLGQALEKESKFCLTYLYSQINFYLQGGDHYLARMTLQL